MQFYIQIGQSCNFVFFKDYYLNTNYNFTYLDIKLYFFCKFKQNKNKPSEMVLALSKGTELPNKSCKKMF